MDTSTRRDAPGPARHLGEQAQHHLSRCVVHHSQPAAGTRARIREGGDEGQGAWGRGNELHATADGFQIHRHPGGVRRIEAQLDIVEPGRKQAVL